MNLENVEDVYVLSPLQEGMLFHTINEPGSGIFVQQICCDLHGTWDTDILKQAWEATIARHAVLRTIFLWDGIDEPMQVVREHVDLPWSEVDLSSANPEKAEAAASQFTTLLRTDRTAGFDLAQAPLMRIHLFHKEVDYTQMIWSFHHILLDGWSVPRVLNEVLARYASLMSGDPINFDRPYAYKDFIAHTQHQSPAASEAFWRSILTGFDTPTRLMEYPAPASPLADQHLNQTLSVPSDLSNQLREFARDQRITVNTAILGAWAFLLSEYTRSDDIVFGTTLSGRPPELPGIEHAVGLFINTLPLRVKLDDTPVTDWLQNIQQDQVQIRQHEQCPLKSVQKWSDIPPGESLFENIVVFENYPAVQDDDTTRALAQHGLSVGDLDYLEQSNFPLALLVVPGEEISFILVHEEARYSIAFANQLLSHLSQVLTAFVTSPQARLSDVSMLSKQEHLHLTKTCNQTAVDIDCDHTMHALISRHASSQADQIAVSYEGQTLTYQALDEQANRLAKKLQDANVSVGERVGLYCERSLELIVGIAGILKAGAAYVPLDPQYPSAHHDRVIADASVKTIVTHGSFSECVPRDHGAVVLIDLSDASPTDPVNEADPNDTAYVIYTSGSQGKPKGVPVSHKNIVHSTLARDHFYPVSPERFLLLSSFAFDSSMVGIFWTLASGGTLVLPKQKAEQDLEQLLHQFSAERITHFLCLPPLYTIILEQAASHDLSALQSVILAGEASPRKLIATHHALLPRINLYNEYGPTEATVWCAATELHKEHGDTAVPIGHPIANTQIYVLDAQLRPVPAGVCGECCITGSGLTQGYINRADQTDERFVPNPFSDVTDDMMYRTGDLVYRLPNDQLVFAGRVDQQLKIRGYRIEPGEIENALRQQEGVSDAIVLTRAQRPNSPDEIDDLVQRLNQLGPGEASRLLAEVQSLSPDETDQHLSEVTS